MILKNKVLGSREIILRHSKSKDSNERKVQRWATWVPPKKAISQVNEAKMIGQWC